MEIKNLSWRPYSIMRKNSDFFPKNIKALIIGKTGSGKTNFLMHCLLCPGWLDYEDLYEQKEQYEKIQIYFVYFLRKKRNLGLIYTDYVGDDMPKDEFLRFCNSCWSKPYGFVVLDLDSQRDKGKYRCGLDEFYIPERQY